jgi:hypothetical protein
MASQEAYKTLYTNNIVSIFQYVYWYDELHPAGCGIISPLLIGTSTALGLIFSSVVSSEDSGKNY